MDKLKERLGGGYINDTYQAKANEYRIDKNHESKSTSGKNVREMYTPTFYIKKLGYARVYLFF